MKTKMKMEQEYYAIVFVKVDKEQTKEKLEDKLKPILGEKGEDLWWVDQITDAELVGS